MGAYMVMGAYKVLYSKLHMKIDKVIKSYADDKNLALSGGINLA